VFGDKMYLYGGSNLEQENMKFLSLDLNSYRWENIKIRSNNYKDNLFASRDEHTAVINNEEQSMIIFGGFKEGIRTNEMLRYTFSTNRWSPVIIDKHSPQPTGRSSHCACMYQGCMYIFGGKDVDHEKLNDLWRFDFQTETWT
jgi:N-acetylneuraminic acid mutarotase